MLYVPNKTTLRFQKDAENKNELHANIDGVDVNLSQLLTQANFSHLQFNQSDSENYENHGVPPITWSLWLRLFGEPAVNHNSLYNFDKLTNAEKYAIGIYTCDGYIGINDLLYKNYKEGYVSENILLNALFLGSGLKKIIRDPATHNTKSYRGEHSVPDEEIQTRINLINQGGGFTEQPAFMSTSTSMIHSKRYMRKSMIIFDHAYGTSIDQFSTDGGQYEFLLPPGQVFWKQYHYENGLHIFHAQTVRPLIPCKDFPCEQEIADFNKLIDLSMNKGVPVFLTQNMQENVLKRVVPTPIVHARPAVPGLIPFKSQPWLAIIFGLLLITIGIIVINGVVIIPYASPALTFVLYIGMITSGIFLCEKSIYLFTKLRAETVNAQNASVLETTKNVQPSADQQIKAQLETEQNAIKALENNTQTNEQKQVLLQYAQKCEEKGMPLKTKDAEDALQTKERGFTPIHL